MPFRPNGHTSPGKIGILKAGGPLPQVFWNLARKALTFSPTPCGTIAYEELIIMSKRANYREQLPQLDGGLFLTDGGLETSTKTDDELLARLTMARGLGRVG